MVLYNAFYNIPVKRLYRVHDSPNTVIRARIDVSTVLCQDLDDVNLASGASLV